MKLFIRNFNQIHSKYKFIIQRMKHYNDFYCIEIYGVLPEKEWSVSLIAWNLPKAK